MPVDTGLPGNIFKHSVIMATASLSSLVDMHRRAGLAVARFDGAYRYREGGGLSPAGCSRRLIERLEQRIVGVGADKIAAFIGKPVYGAGVIMPQLGATAHRYFPLAQVKKAEFLRKSWVDVVQCESPRGAICPEY